MPSSHEIGNDTPAEPEEAPTDPHARADALRETADRDIAQERAEADGLGERIEALEKDVFPPRPQPETPGQAIGD